MRSSPSAPSRRMRGGFLPLLLAALCPLVRAQGQEPGKAAGVFDPAPAKKPAAATKKTEAAAKSATVTDRDTIGFTQENAAAQMVELEERMFRLSEALRGLEPENASRLRLALKFSREELILEQMRASHKLLKAAQLSRAETEVRELLAKLEHLRSLLLAEDLDFQLKMARLRQMRETLSQLERIIKEERRELAWSRLAIDAPKSKESLAARRMDLEALVREQTAVLAETRKAQAGDNTAGKALVDRERAVRAATSALAAGPLFAKLDPPHLKRADPHLGDALSHLDARVLDAAVAAEAKALELLQAELDRLDERLAQADLAVAEPEFRRHEADQAKNRDATDTLAAVSARLGDAGVSLRKDLIRAGASMRDAEKDLARTAAEPAATDQNAALEVLTKSRDGLSQATEKLLVELRTELQSRIIAELTEMHERQAAIRESTQAQAPKILQKSRTALIAVAGLSKQETKLDERTTQLLALVEETEFGIALPTALRVLAREMRTIATWLKEGDASPRTIALEQRVEDDLLGLLQAIRRLPPTTPPPPGTPLPSDLRARERELNRLVSELKMIRLMQARLNEDTVRVDQSRPGEAALPPESRRAIEALKSSQIEIQDSLSKIAERIENSDNP